MTSKRLPPDFPPPFELEEAGDGAAAPHGTRGEPPERVESTPALTPAGEANGTEAEALRRMLRGVLVFLIAAGCVTVLTLADVYWLNLAVAATLLLRYAAYIVLR